MAVSSNAECVTTKGVEGRAESSLGQITCHGADARAVIDEEEDAADSREQAAGEALEGDADVVA